MLGMWRQQICLWVMYSLQHLHQQVRWKPSVSRSVHASSAYETTTASAPERVRVARPHPLLLSRACHCSVAILCSRGAGAHTQLDAGADPLRASLCSRHTREELWCSLLELVCLIIAVHSTNATQRAPHLLQRLPTSATRLPGLCAPPLYPRGPYWHHSS